MLLSRPPRNTRRTASAISILRRSLLIFRQDLFQVVRHLWYRLFEELHRISLLDDDVILPSPCVVQLRVVQTTVSSAAFAPGESRERAGFGNLEHALDVAREVPAWIEEPRAFDTHERGPRLQLFDFRQSAPKVLFGAKNANESLHHVLQIMVNLVRALAAGTVKGREQLLLGLLDLGAIDSRGSHFLRVLRRRQSRAASED